MCCQDDGFDARRNPNHLANRIESIQDGQGDVEDRDVGMTRLGQLDGLAAVRGLADDLEPFVL